MLFHGTETVEMWGKKISLGILIAQISRRVCSLAADCCKNCLPLGTDIGRHYSSKYLHQLAFACGAAAVAVAIPCTIEGQAAASL